jgi:hypothetical protein
MSKLARRLRHLSQKAAEIKQAVDAAPQQAAKFRESVVMAAGQLQQLRSEVQSSFVGVHVDNEERLARVMRELNESQPLLQEVGYELSGVDVEFTPVQRVIVRLEKFQEASGRDARSLAASETRGTVRALLSSIVKAEELAGKVNLDNLQYRGLVIHVGAIPTVRICWSSGLDLEETAVVTVQPGHPVPATVTTPPVFASPPAAPASLVGFGQSTMFESRPMPARPSGTTNPASTVQTASPATAASHTNPPEPETVKADWKQEALERFKKMPSVSKYRK